MPRLVSGGGLSLLILASLLVFGFFSPVFSSSFRAGAGAAAAPAAVGGANPSPPPALNANPHAKWSLAMGMPKITPIVSNVHATLETNLSPSSSSSRPPADTPLHRLSQLQSLLQNQNPMRTDSGSSSSSSPKEDPAHDPSSSKDGTSAPESTARWLLSLVYPSQSQEQNVHGAALPAAAPVLAHRKNDSSSAPSFVQRIIPFPSVYRSKASAAPATADDDGFQNAHRNTKDSENDTPPQVAQQKQELTPKPSSTESKIPMKPQPQPQLLPAQAVQAPSISSSYSTDDDENSPPAAPYSSELEPSFPQQQKNHQQIPMQSHQDQQQQQQDTLSSEAQDNGAGQPVSSISSAIFSIIHNDPPPGKGISLREKEIGGSCLGLVISVVFAILLF
ncbi:hypothetical protein KEM56_002394 [Ascosphaera pollenicola]|nr:hypothetical protein KEM56_002394 [Ascosphaera pollenicola]